MSFIKGFFSSCLGALIALIIFTLGIFIFFVMGSSNPVIINTNSVLHLKLDKPISELEVEDELPDLFPDISDTRIGLLQLKNVISQAAIDSKIEGIYLDLSDVSAGLTALREVRSSLSSFRESGKWIVAYANNFSEATYYLSSVASEIYLNPQGMIEFNGLSAEVMHYKRLLDKLEIKPVVFRVGEFKSAVEPFLLDKMSPENRFQLDEMLRSIHNQMLTDISASRNIPIDKLTEMSKKMLVRNAQQAVDLNLIDSICYDDQV